MKYLAGVGALASFSPLNAYAGRKGAQAPVTSTKNLVIVVNMLGYNQHTFNPRGNDLDHSPLVSQLKAHYDDLTVFRNIMQPEIVRGHNGGRGILTCNKNQTNGPYISLDQLACEHLQQTTRHKSVHMGNKTIVWNTNSRAVPAEEYDTSKQYNRSIKGVLAKYCFNCHASQDAEGDLRIDQLDPDFVRGNDADHWFDVLSQLNRGTMPPDGEPRIPSGQLREVVDWLTGGLKQAAASKAGSGRHVRRLNNGQYANTVKDLFGLSVDYSGHLLEDSTAKNGFATNASALFTSTAHMEQYMTMAHEIVDRAIPSEPPTVHHMKMQFGRKIGENRRGSIGRYPVPANHFKVTRMEAKPPFKTHQLDEVYKIKGERKEAGKIVSLNSRDHTYYVTRYFADDYKNADGAYVKVDGLELQPIRHARKTRQTLPDEPTLVVTLRDFPLRGRFALRVEAYRVDPKNLIAYREVGRRNKPNEKTVSDADIVVHASMFEVKQNMEMVSGKLVSTVPTQPSQAEYVFNVPSDGIYLLHRWCEFAPPLKGPKRPNDGPQISINEETIVNCFRNRKLAVAPECIVQLKQGRNVLSLDGGFATISLRAISMTRLKPTDRRAAQFAKRHQVVPTLRAFMGSNNGEARRYIDQVHDVRATKQKPEIYMFYGDLEEFPIPATVKPLEKFETSLMSFGVENNQLVTPHGPSIIIKSIEFEGPLHTQWPTKAEQEIFFSRESQPDEAAYAEAILKRFLTRAYRRPPTEHELGTIHAFWTQKRLQSASFKQSIKEALVLVLTTPQFLFMTEEPATANSKELSDYQLASRLSYFLWNSMPDEQLLVMARNGTLKKNLSEEVMRLLANQKSLRFSTAFSRQWLEMDKADLVVWEEPLSNYYRQEFARETQLFFHEVLKSNASVTTFVDSDFAMVNQNLADYYGIRGQYGGTFRKVQIDQSSRRGGVLTNGIILLANSTGLKSHPVKRGAWLAGRILGSPPPDPPVGIPEIDELDPKFQRLSLVEQLEVHRNYESCRHCHQQIDPWGLPFESYDAGGRLVPNAKPISSTLPDQTTITGMAELKKYLNSERQEDVARSVVSHLLSYAIGRELGFEDMASVDSVLQKTRRSGFRMHDVIKAIVESKSFLRK